ncbi:MAG: hypothetical protein H6581_20290 [Bacteroidia bacterium]|nr:hypothetical protein [Bacteroidia bacterium]
MEDAIAGIFTILVLAFFVATYVMVALSVQKIARNSDESHYSWFAWIPILHEVLLLKIVKKPEWWIVIIYFVPIANWVMRWVLQYELVKYCRKPGWWIAVFIFFFPAYPFMIWKMAQDYEAIEANPQNFADQGQGTTQESFF